MCFCLRPVSVFPPLFSPASWLVKWVFIPGLLSCSLLYCFLPFCFLHLEFPSLLVSSLQSQSLCFCKSFVYFLVSCLVLPFGLPCFCNLFFNLLSFFLTFVFRQDLLCFGVSFCWKILKRKCFVAHPAFGSYYLLLAQWAPHWTGKPAARIRFPTPALTLMHYRTLLSIVKKGTATGQTSLKPFSTLA